MKKLIVILVMGLMAAQFIGCAQKPSAASESKIDLVARGKYLVNTSACHDCHSPKLIGPNGIPMVDSTRLLSGHPAELPHPIWTPADLQERNALTMANPMLTSWAGPWGVSFTANLTPDTSTGLGEWMEETFMRAIRTGKHQGQPNGRDILPPMPWDVYRNFTDQDLKAIWAYLRSLPPVKNQVPFPIPPSASPMAAN
ncbi:c-type cytochrome [candidate division KSB1 bacterium]|nr:c-type cytochrome [candidate division KSB1 bacterium]